MTTLVATGAAAVPRAASQHRTRRHWGRLAAWVWLGFVVLFIYAPILVVIGASVDPGHYVVTRAFLQFPPHGFTLHWYVNVAPALWASVFVSLKLAAAVTVGAVLLGAPAALGLVRGQFPGRNLVATLFRMPLQIPFIVTGVAFLQSFYAVASVTGLRLQASFAGLFLAHLFVTTPYVVSAAGTALAQLSPRLEEAALSLGASRWRAFWLVTLPLILPGIFGGAMFAFLVSFTDVTIALFLAPQNAITFPVWVFGSIQNDLETSLPAVSTMVFVASALAVVALQRLVGMETVLRSGGGAKS
jgi:ABC-type spermidine/putrescine transport system permease subunit II